jgi:hypothetical protein
MSNFMPNDKAKSESFGKLIRQALIPDCHSPFARIGISFVAHVRSCSQSYTFFIVGPLAGAAVFGLRVSPRHWDELDVFSRNIEAAGSGD